MKSLYDITFNKMKYSSVRLLAAIFLLGLTVFVIFDSVTNFTCISEQGGCILTTVAEKKFKDYKRRYSYRYMICFRLLRHDGAAAFAYIHQDLFV